MLPLSLLLTARGSPMLVELKNGETYNGHLDACDNWMNLNLTSVICTSAEGDKFYQLSEVYIRGTTIKYVRVADDIIDKVRERQQQQPKHHKYPHNNSQRGRGRGRGGRTQ